MIHCKVKQWKTLTPAHDRPTRTAALATALIQAVIIVLLLSGKNLFTLLLLPNSITVQVSRDSSRRFTHTRVHTNPQYVLQISSFDWCQLVPDSIWRQKRLLGQWELGVAHVADVSYISTDAINILVWYLEATLLSLGFALCVADGRAAVCQRRSH